MAKTSAVRNQMHTPWFAMSSTIPSTDSTARSYRSDWTNKRSNKGFYTFTTDRTPGGYIG